MANNRIVYVVENEGVPSGIGLDRKTLEDSIEDPADAIVEYIPRSELAELQDRYDELLGRAKRNVAIDRAAELAAVQARMSDFGDQDARLKATLHAKELFVQSMRSELSLRRFLDDLPDPHEGDGSELDPLRIAEQMRKFTEGVREVEGDL